jgi:WD40 repeat protein
VFLPDSKTAIAVCQDDSNLHILDVATGKERSAFEAHKQGVGAAAVSADGKYLATGGGDNTVRLWDAKTFKEIRSFNGHTKEVLALAFSPDGKTLASGGADHHIRIWDVASGNEKGVWTGHELAVLSLSFSPDGKTLASGGICTTALPGLIKGATHSDVVRLFDVQTGKEIHKLSQRGSTVSFTPDGRALAVAGNYLSGVPRDGSSSIYRGSKAMLAPTGKNAEWISINGFGSTLALSADGRLLALAYGNQWHMARTQAQGKFKGGGWIEEDVEHRQISVLETATGKEIMRLPEEYVTAVAISQDGKKLAAGASSGKVQFLNLAPKGWAYAGKTPQLAAEELDKLWNVLAQEAAAPAYSAVWTLSAAGQPVVTYLKDKLTPEKAAGEQAKELLVKLDSDKYAVREAAFRDLKKLGPAIESELRKALADGKTSVDVRKRLQPLLDGWDKRPASPEELRQVRALQVLERIGSPEAKAVLARLAEGAPGAWLTDQARLSVTRLERQKTD